MSLWWTGWSHLEGNRPACDRSDKRVQLGRLTRVTSFVKAWLYKVRLYNEAMRSVFSQPIGRYFTGRGNEPLYRTSHFVPKGISMRHFIFLLFNC